VPLTALARQPSFRGNRQKRLFARGWWAEAGRSHARLVRAVAERRQTEEVVRMESDAEQQRMEEEMAERAPNAGPEATQV
jgi:hypothetical protein